MNISTLRIYSYKRKNEYEFFLIILSSNDAHLYAYLFISIIRVQYT